MDEECDFGNMSKTIDDRETMLKYSLFFILGTNIGIFMMICLLFNNIEYNSVMLMITLLAIDVVAAVRIYYAIYKGNKLKTFLKEYKECNSEDRVKKFFRIIIYVILNVPSYKKFLKKDQI